ncbi:MAG: hypothetical protein Q7U04_09330 [Bacteriovorax sp.]|nr:hypothetical protein [Bacteriovorax sp.]
MKSLFILGMVLVNVSAFAGNEKGNGGFLYSRTSKKLLDISQASLLNELDSVLKKRNELVYNSSVCSKPVDFRELNSAITDLTYSYDAKPVGTNPDGKEERKYFQINNENKVEATELYFASFVDTYFRYNETTELNEQKIIIAPVRAAIIHESLHLFGYNEMESRACTSEMISVLESYNPTKLEQAITKTIQLNIKLTEERLIKYECVTTRDLENAKQLSNSIHGYEYLRQYGRKVLKCVVDKFTANEGQITSKKGSAKNGSVLIITNLGQVMSKSENVAAVASYLNGIMKFSFEIELPKSSL